MEDEVLGVKTGFRSYCETQETANLFLESLSFLSLKTGY